MNGYRADVRCRFLNCCLAEDERKGLFAGEGSVAHNNAANVVGEMLTFKCEECGKESKTIVQG